MLLDPDKCVGRKRKAPLHEKGKEAEKHQGVRGRIQKSAEIQTDQASSAIDARYIEKLREKFFDHLKVAMDSLPKNCEKLQKDRNNGSAGLSQTRRTAQKRQNRYPTQMRRAMVMRELESTITDAIKVVGATKIEPTTLWVDWA